MISAKYRKDSGFVALITAIILTAILLIVVVTLNQTSFFTRGILLDSEYKERSTALAEACFDIARLKLANDPTYSGGELAIPIGSGFCDIRSVSSNIIKTRAVSSGSVTNLEIEVGPPPNLSIISWEETPLPL